MCASAYEDQMNVSETMKLELQVAVHYSTHVLRTKLRSSVYGKSTLN